MIALGLGLGTSFVRGASTPPLPPTDPDAEAFFARLPDALTDNQKALYISFYIGVKEFNRLTSIDNGLFYGYFMGGLGTQANSRKNLVSASYDLSNASGTPTWANTGFTGGSGIALGNGFTDSSNVPASALNDLFLCVYISTDTAGLFELDAGNWDDGSLQNCFIGSKYSGVAKGLINNPAADSNELSASNSNAIGLYSITRIGNTMRLWKNGSVIFTSVLVPAALVTQSNLFLAVRYGSNGNPLRYSTKEQYFAVKGFASRIDQADLNYRIGLLRAGTVWTAKPKLGTIFSDDFARATVGSNYTNASGAFSCNGTNLVAVNTSGGQWNKSLNYTFNGYKTNLEKTIQTVHCSVSSTSDKGIAIGYKGTYFDLQVSFEFDTGNITFRNGVGVILLSTSASSMSLSNGDLLEITVNNHKDRFECTVNNTTQSTTLSHTYTFSMTAPIVLNSGIAVLRPNNWEPVLYATGGTVNITHWDVTSQAEKNGNIVFIGDSNFSCCFPEYQENRLCDRVGLGKYYNVYAGPGNKTSDINWQEVVRLKPQKAVINLGTNDIANGVSVATAVANVRTGVDILQAAGITVIICKIPPLNTNDVQPYNAALVTEFGGLVGPDLFSVFVGTGFQWNATYSPDGVHINAAGQILAANEIDLYA